MRGRSRELSDGERPRDEDVDLSIKVWMLMLNLAGGKAAAAIPHAP